MNQFKPHILLQWSVLKMIVVALISFQVVLVAQTRTHILGDYKLRIDANDALNTNDDDPTGEWPQDQFRSSTVVWYNSGFTVGSWL